MKQKATYACYLCESLYYKYSFVDMRAWHACPCKRVIQNAEWLMQCNKVHKLKIGLWRTVMAIVGEVRVRGA